MADLQAAHEAPVLVALTAATRRIAGSVQAEAALQVLVEHLAHVLAYTELSIWQRQRDRLCCRYHVPGLSRRADDEALARTVIASGAAYREPAGDEASRAGALLAVPLLTGDTTIGALLVRRHGAGPFTPGEALILESFGALATATLAHESLAEARRAHAGALARLHEISLALNADLDPRRVVERIAQSSKELTGANFSSVMLVEGRNQPYLYVTTDPLADSPIHQPQSIRPEGTTATVLRTGQPIVINDVQTDDRVSPLVRERGIGAVVGLPLVIEGRAVGVLWVNYHQPRYLSRDEMTLLGTLAAQAATAIHNARLYSEARTLAERDSMTGLVNYRALQDRLQNLLASAQRTGQEVSLLMIDLNNFKHVNDTYGHLVGDAVLCQVAQSLTNACRESDVVGRYGGDEFLVILPNTDAAGALILARRLEVALSTIGAEGSDEPLAFATGLATWPEDGTDFATLVAAADRRLYAAKRAAPLGGPSSD